jgi:hypothetical protein
MLSAVSVSRSAALTELKHPYRTTGVCNQGILIFASDLTRKLHLARLITSSQHVQFGLRPDQFRQHFTLKVAIGNPHDPCSLGGVSSPVVIEGCHKA